MAPHSPPFAFVNLLLEQYHPARSNSSRTTIPRRNIRNILRIEIPKRQSIVWKILDEPVRHPPRGFQVLRVAGQGVELCEAVDAPRLPASPGAVVGEALRGAAQVDFAGGGAVVADVEGGAVGTDVVLEGFVGVGEGDGEVGGVVGVG